MTGGQNILWRPHTGPQERALASPAFELMYGGAAGSGKSDFLLAGAIRYLQIPQFSGVFFRRSFPEMEDAIARARELFEPWGGKFTGDGNFFRFPSGARFYLLHLQLDRDAFKHRGRAYQYIAFDELTTFSKFQYTYLMSRARSVHGIPIEIRSGTNPEPGWVKDRWAPWVDESWQGERAKPGEILWYKADKQGTERYVPYGTKGALSRTFQPGRLRDNPSLGQDYADQLYSTQDPVQVARLLRGDWSAVYAPGLMFKRGWFELVPAAPGRAWRVRYWDRAATDPEKSKNPGDPDWTVGCLMAWEGPDSGKPFYVEDIVRFRGNPGEVWNTIVQTSKLDRQRYGNQYMVGLEQEPGGGGKFEVHSYMSGLQGFDVQAFPPEGNKVARAGPMSAQACFGVGPMGGYGNVKLVNGIWVKSYLDELEAFPQKGVHDDQVDASSGAFGVLTKLPKHIWQSIGGQSPAQARFGHLPAF